MTKHAPWKLQQLEVRSDRRLRDEREPSDWYVPIECVAGAYRIVSSWAEISQSPLRTFEGLTADEKERIRASHVSSNPYALELHVLMREERDESGFLWVFRCGEFQPARWCLDFEGLWLLSR